VRSYRSLCRNGEYVNFFFIRNYLPPPPPPPYPLPFNVMTRSLKFYTTAKSINTKQYVQHMNTHAHTRTKININILIMPKFTSTVTKAPSLTYNDPTKRYSFKPTLLTDAYKPWAYTTSQWVLHGLINGGCIHLGGRGRLLAE